MEETREKVLIELIEDDNGGLIIHNVGNVNDLLVAYADALVTLELSMPEAFQARFRSQFLETLNYIRREKIENK